MVVKTDDNSMYLNNTFVHLMDYLTQKLYILSDGRMGHNQLGWTILLLTTTGRKTGVPRTHTLVYFKDGDRLLVVASNNGSDQPPAWYLNLVANPHVHIRYGRNKGCFVARTATTTEYPGLWQRLIAYHPPYASHQAHTRRKLSIVILTPLVG